MSVAPRKDSGVNKFRDDCRRQIQECRHPELTYARKCVLLKLADLIDDRKDWTAYPAFSKLAKYASVSRDTAIRAVNVGKKVGLLVRVKRAGIRGLGGTTNRYEFRPNEVAGETGSESERGSRRATAYREKEVAGRPPKRSQACNQRSSRPATQQSNRQSNLHSKTAPPSSSVEPDAVVAKKELGEEGRQPEPPVWTTPSITEVEDAPTLRKLARQKLYERAVEEVFTPSDVPQRFYRVRKQTKDELDAEMAAGGLDLSASKRRGNYSCRSLGDYFCCSPLIGGFCGLRYRRHHVTTN